MAYIFDNDVVFYEYERANRYVQMLYQCGMAIRMEAWEETEVYYTTYLVKENWK